MGNDFRGDPAAGDGWRCWTPSRTSRSRDHYIELPFDLSDVLFLTTANDLSTVPRPLLDRMEVIELSSYTEEEKRQIALHHLLPKQMEKHGLHKGQLVLSEKMLGTGDCAATRARPACAGWSRCWRSCAGKRLSTCGGRRTSADGDLRKIWKSLLGVARYKDDVVQRKRTMVGIVNGLAWTSVGGEMLEVEVAVVPGTGKIEVTGNLGTVMQESAKAAVTFVRSKRAGELSIDPMFYKDNDLHIHFPEAAIPKDGPSAGVTITTALWFLR